MLRLYYRERDRHDRGQRWKAAPYIACPVCGRLERAPVRERWGGYWTCNHVGASS